MIRWPGMAVAGVLLLSSPMLVGLGTGQGLPAADVSAGGAVPPWAAVPPADQGPGGYPQANPGGQMPAIGGGAAGEMMGFSRPTADGGQLLTLIDTSRRWMAVYHIEGSGQIHLKSARPLTQDFAVQYNAAAPLPEDMRQLVGD